MISTKFFMTIFLAMMAADAVNAVDVGDGVAEDKFVVFGFDSDEVA